MKFLALMTTSLLFNAAVFSMEIGNDDLTKSTVQIQKNAFDKIFKQLKETAKQDNLRPLVYHLTDLPFELWESLIRIAWDKQALSSLDLMWAIEQVSIANPKISKGQADYLFEEIILNPLKRNSRARKLDTNSMYRIVIYLLTNTFIPQGPYSTTDGMWSKWVQGKQILATNVMNLASDFGYVEALEKIFNSAASTESFFTGVACTQRVWSSYFSKVSDDKYFGFIDWLIRNDHPSPKTAIKIAQKLCEASLKNDIKIKGKIINLLAWLGQKNSFPANLTWETILKNHVDSFYGLDTSLITTAQKEKLCEIISTYKLTIHGQSVLGIREPYPELAL